MTLIFMEMELSKYLITGHNVPYQKFGTYEGSGVAGNYVHLGFRPALIWIKNVDSTSINNWGIIDSLVLMRT